MYHLSKNELHKEILKPRVPINHFTKNNYEENTIKRICFSNTIDNALMALDQKLNGQIFYVYKPNNKIKVITNKEIIENKWVPDAHITKELWSIEETELIAVAKIKIIKPIGEFYEFKYGENDGYTCQWEYELLKTY